MKIERTGQIISVIIMLGLMVAFVTACNAGESAAEVGESVSETEESVDQAGDVAMETEESGSADSVSATPLEISFGEEVDIDDYVVSGKVNILYFTSEYCPPCRAIRPRMTQLHSENADINVVLININRPDVQGIDWQSPVVSQHGVRSVPYFVIIEKDGTRLEGNDTRPRLEELFELL